MTEEEARRARSRRQFLRDAGAAAAASTLFAACAKKAAALGRPIDVVELDGAHPGVPSITPDGRFIVSVNQGTSNLSVVDAKTLALVRTIPLSAGNDPWEMGITSDGALGVVSHSAFTSSHTEPSVVTFVDLEAGVELGTTAVGARPNGVVIDAADRFAYVANMGTNDVSVVDLAARSEVARIPVGKSPFDVGLTPDGKQLVVVNFYDASLSFVDVATRAVTATVVVGTPAIPEPYPEFGAGDSAQLDIHRDTGVVYVSNYRTHEVVAVDAATREIVARIPTIDFPFGILVEERNNLVTVLSGESRQIGVIDLGANDALRAHLESAPTAKVRRWNKTRLATAEHLGAEPLPESGEELLHQIEESRNTQIEVIPLGQGGDGKPPLAIAASRADALTLVHVDPIKGVAYRVPRNPDTLGLIAADRPHSGA